MGQNMNAKNVMPINPNASKYNILYNALISSLYIDKVVLLLIMNNN